MLPLTHLCSPVMAFDRLQASCEHLLCSLRQLYLSQLSFTVTCLCVETEFYPTSKHAAYIADWPFLDIVCAHATNESDFRNAMKDWNVVFSSVTGFGGQWYNVSRATMHDGRPSRSARTAFWTESETVERSGAAPALGWQRYHLSSHKLHYPSTTHSVLCGLIGTICLLHRAVCVSHVVK